MNNKYLTIVISCFILMVCTIANAQQWEAIPLVSKEIRERAQTGGEGYQVVQAIGSTWAIVNSTYGNCLLKVHPEKGDIYIANQDGFYKSPDGGQTFVKRLSENVPDLDVVVIRKDRVYLKTASKFFKSNDGGEIFNPISSASLPSNIMSLNVSLANSVFITFCNKENDCIDPTNDFQNRMAPIATDLFQPKHARIMPIGNSITENNDPGYRGYLYQKLKADGFDVDFVGTKQSMPSNGGDPDHSKYGGFIVGPGASKGDSWNPPFKGNIYDNLDEGYDILSNDCDIIILEIGINDFFNSTDSTYQPNITGAEKLDGLIYKIFILKPDVHLIVSNITPVGFDANFASLWNSQVPSIVEKYKKQGRKCYLADIHNGILWNTSLDLGLDKLHPMASGYEKMADLYLKILATIMNK